MKKQEEFLSWRIADALGRFFSLSLVLLFLFILVRVYELTIVAHFSHFPPQIYKSECIGFFFDFLLFLKFSSFLLLFYFPLYFVNPKLAKAIYIVGSIKYLFISIALIQYFGITLIPLGVDIFGYSLKEIAHIIGHIS